MASKNQWTSKHTFNHLWETVCQAVWRKYPNPINPAVIGADVVERRVENGILLSHRLICWKFDLPRLIQPILGRLNSFYAIEVSEVNIKSKAMVLETKNSTFRSFITLDETLSYHADPKDSSKTLLKQETHLTVLRSFPFHDYFESLLVSTMKTNAEKGLQALEWVTDDIEGEISYKN
ncbi:hypothetical protein LSTR_LSTR004229 [Laodelphax striatellus]|uniref:PRELI/MSF1 domain-containing protein n=1 Tax=Laodelphax striatellus TaxID=195883 RepID=A0A482XD50_LAOST|nr:hypothetical protein LSTR_LSTR004229 [Laodelphax striatellus]